MGTEYNNIENIGKTYASFDTPTEKLLHEYYHKQEICTVTHLLKKMKIKNFYSVVDLGSSHGFWYNNYKSLGFKKIIGIDISSERVNQAKQRGYDEVHTCNAYDLPFNNETKDCIISNNVLVHVLQDSDKLRIFKEVKRVLKKNGIFIFNIANASDHGCKTDTTHTTSRMITPETILKLINTSELSLEAIMPCFYTFPMKGAHPYFASFSTKFIFPITDFILRKINNLVIAKVIYFGVRKKV